MAWPDGPGPASLPGLHGVRLCTEPVPFSSTYVGGDPCWAASADKHGVPHEDALHAIEHAIERAVYVEVEFADPRLGGRVRPTLFVPCSK